MNIPARLQGIRQTVLFDEPSFADLTCLREYMKDIIGVDPGNSGVIRVALKRYKEWMDAQFVETLIEAPKESMEEFNTFKLAEKQLIIKTNHISPARVPTKE